MAGRMVAAGEEHHKEAVAGVHRELAADRGVGHSWDGSSEEAARERLDAGRAEAAHAEATAAAAAADAGHLEDLAVDAGPGDIVQDVEVRTAGAAGVVAVANCIRKHLGVFDSRDGR